jgi:hypothetical protein
MMKKKLKFNGGSVNVVEKQYILRLKEISTKEQISLIGIVLEKK